MIVELDSGERYDTDAEYTAHDLAAHQWWLEGDCDYVAQVVGGRVLWQNVEYPDGYDGTGKVRIWRLEGSPDGILLFKRYVDPETKMRLVKRC